MNKSINLILLHYLLTEMFLYLRIKYLCKKDLNCKMNGENKPKKVTI